MMAVPCEDAMAKYNAMSAVWHDAATMHVSNVYNVKTETSPYNAISDANARIEDSKGQGR